MTNIQVQNWRKKRCCVAYRQTSHTKHTKFHERPILLPYSTILRNNKLFSSTPAIFSSTPPTHVEPQVCTDRERVHVWCYGGSFLELLTLQVIRPCVCVCVCVCLCVWSKITYFGAISCSLLADAEKMWTDEIKHTRKNRKAGKLTWYKLICLFGPSLWAWKKNITYKHLVSICTLKETHIAYKRIHTYTHTCMHVYTYQFNDAITAFWSCF